MKPKPSLTNNIVSRASRFVGVMTGFCLALFFAAGFCWAFAASEFLEIYSIPEMRLVKMDLRLGELDCRLDLGGRTTE